MGEIITTILMVALTIYILVIFAVTIYIAYITVKEKVSQRQGRKSYCNFIKESIDIQVEYINEILDKYDIENSDRVDLIDCQRQLKDNMERFDYILNAWWKWW